MKRIIEMKPIQELTNEINKNMEESLQRVRENYQRKLRNMEEHRRLIPLLDAEGVPLEVYKWDQLETLCINLGKKPQTKKGRQQFVRWLQAIRRVVDCPLVNQGTVIPNSRTREVEVTLCPTNYPDLRVKYRDKLPKDAKCKVVRKRVRYTEVQLVCED
jgi:hypothetical protein